MEKLIYPVWGPDGLGQDIFRDQLLQNTGTALLDMENVRALRIAVVDSAVQPAADKRLQTCHTLPDGMISLWVNNGGARAAIEDAIALTVERFTAYLVTEAAPIVNTLHPNRSGERVYGMCQVVFLQRPERLSEQQWLEIWQGSHTRVAIDTQSTFCYRQNVIARSLCEDQPEFHAVVEENFPPDAMTSELAFYGVNDDQGLRENQRVLMESCARFIDFDKIDVVPMSEYVLKDIPA